jgi:L-aminopeptidase/D-esterase-like protein
LNAITDVLAVEVGYTTLIAGATRSGAHGRYRHPAPRQAIEGSRLAGCFALNGNGEMTGTAWIEESGFLEGPVMITNTHSVLHRS